MAAPAEARGGLPRTSAEGLLAPARSEHAGEPDARAHPELAVDALEVGFDSALGHEEGLRDLGVCQAGGDEICDPPLDRREDAYPTAPAGGVSPGDRARPGPGRPRAARRGARRWRAKPPAAAERGSCGGRAGAPRRPPAASSPPRREAAAVGGRSAPPRVLPRLGRSRPARRATAPGSGRRARSPILSRGRAIASRRGRAARPLRRAGRA